MRLVANWTQAWRWLSVQALLFLTLAPIIWAELPPEAKDLIPEAWRPWIIAVVAVAGIIGRVKDQGSTALPPQDSQGEEP
jgi:hypothetical protein